MKIVNKSCGANNSFNSKQKRLNFCRQKGNVTNKNSFIVIKFKLCDFQVQYFSVFLLI
jgi:hypothetical protein